MALTDLLKGAGRVVQAAALGLAVYGCGGSETGNGGKAKEPTYEGMCDEYRSFLDRHDCTEQVTNSSVKTPDELYTQCQEYCEPYAPTSHNRLYTCAAIYCALQISGCSSDNFYSPTFQDCLEDFGLPRYERSGEQGDLVDE